MGLPQFPLRLLLLVIRAIAVSAECNRDTVYEALKVLEWAGVLTWQNRIARIQVRERDLFGRWASRWRVIRTSNAYVFRDPQQRPEGLPASKSENPAVTLNQDFQSLIVRPADPNNHDTPRQGPANAGDRPRRRPSRNRHRRAPRRRP